MMYEYGLMGKPPEYWRQLDEEAEAVIKIFEDRLAKRLPRQLSLLEGGNDESDTISEG